MRKRILSLILALCMVFSLMPVTALATEEGSIKETPASVPVAATDRYDLSAQLHGDINGLRSENELPELERNATLTELAMQRAAEIAVYYDENQIRPDGSDTTTILEGAYTDWAEFEELILCDDLFSADKILGRVKRKNDYETELLNTSYTQMGVGCVQVNNMDVCWVVLLSNSTTDVETTDRTDTINHVRNVSVLTSNVEEWPGGVIEYQPAHVGFTWSRAIRVSNSEGCEPYVMPELSPAVNRKGETIATLSYADWEYGILEITMVKPGIGEVELPLYEGQPNPLRLIVTCSDGENAPVPPDPEVHESGTWGDNLTWTMEGTTLTISGTGDMVAAGDIDSYYPWKYYKDATEALVVEDGVTGLAASAFSDFSILTAVTLPDTLTTLGYGLFQYCDSLERITIPDGVEEIPEYCFDNCAKLSEVTFPETMTALGKYCFSGCPKLAVVTLPKGITVIPENCFRYSGLVELHIPDRVKSIEANAFYACDKLEKMWIPDTVTNISLYPFPSHSDMTIYCYNLSYIHVWAEKNGINVEILPEEPGTVYYPVIVYANEGGTVEISNQESPADRYVWLTVTPDPGYVTESVYYQTLDGSELEGVKTNGNTIEFLMPACPVAFEVTFINTVLPFVDVTEKDYFYVPVMWALNHGITAGMDATHFAPNKTCTRGQVVTFLWRAAGEPEPESLENPFSDVKESDFYYKAVLWAVENGITAGMGVGTFKPNAPCTRGQVVTFLWRACGEPSMDGYKNWFVDVEKDAFYYDAVLWAASNKITSGMNSTHFMPDNVCSRGQIVTFLFRAFYG